MKKILILAAAILSAGLTIPASHAGFGTSPVIQIVSRDFLYSQPATGGFKGDIMCFYEQVEFKGGQYYQTRVVKIGPISPRYGQSCYDHEI